MSKIKASLNGTFNSFFMTSLAVSTLYLWIITTLGVFASDNIPNINPILILGASFVFSFFVLKLFSTRVSKIQMNAKNQKSMVWGFVISIITFVFLVIYFMGQYPGGVCPDVIRQYRQAIGETPYCDWHPVLHTLLFFTIPLKLGFNLSFIVVLQLFWFSLAFGYLLATLHRNGCPRIFVLAACVFIWLNPFTATYMMYPWKDIGFTIFSMLLVAYYVQTMCSKGAWLLKFRNIILFSVVTIICTFMRHNAILFVGPVVIITLLCLTRSWKTRLLSFISMLTLFSVVKLTYNSLKVEPPDKRIVETIGLPATIWCNVMKKNPQALPEETRNVFYQFATQEDYETKYITGSFNSIKWATFDEYKMDKLTYAGVLKYTVQCFQYAPKESYEAIIKLTSLVWNVNHGKYPMEVNVIENNYGFKKDPSIIFKPIVDFMKQMCNFKLINIFFGSTGFHLLILLIIALLLLTNRRSSILHIIPLLCYDFGTMILLSGDDYRFFLFNIPLWFPIIFIMLKDKKTFYLKKSQKRKETSN